MSSRWKVALGAVVLAWSVGCVVESNSYPECAAGQVLQTTQSGDFACADVTAPGSDAGELFATIDALKAEVAALRAQLDTLSADAGSRLAALEGRVGSLDALDIGTRLAQLEASFATVAPGDAGSRLLTLEESMLALTAGTAPDGGVAELTQCPRGYSPGGSAPFGFGDAGFVLCSKTVRQGATGSANDEVVKVGDFWIDRFEMHNCSTVAPSRYGESAGARACSVRGVAPLANVSMFGAAQACIAAGKHLCSNAEWQAAAAGTDTNGCTGTTIVATGTRGCTSRYGAEDMSGNLWDGVADWLSGVGNRTGTPQTLDVVNPWPDAPPIVGAPTIIRNPTHNASSVANGIVGLPAWVMRGGSNNTLGIFSLNLDNGPEREHQWIGARCCMSR